MKAKIIGFISFFLFLSLLFAFAASGEEASAPSADAARQFALYDVDSENFLMKKNIDDVISPSSTVKIMSGLIVCEKLKTKADEDVTLTAEMLEGASGKNMELTPGTKVNIKDLMFAAYGCGYNDAATALAVIAAGSTDEMVELMNKRARELRMYSTVYTNVTGLDDKEMKTTVRDTAALAAEAAENELFLEVSTVYNHSVKYIDGGERMAYGNNEIVNKNSTYYCSSAKGMNSGATDSGACLVTFGEHNGIRCVVIAMGCSDQNDSRFALVQDSLDWAYKRSYTTLLQKGDGVGEISVDMSQTENLSVGLVLSEDLTAFVSDVENKELIRYTLIMEKEKLEAPLSRGTVVGKYAAWYGNEIRGIANVTVAEDVEKSAFLGLLGGIENYLTGRAFIVTLIALAVSAVIIIVYPILALSKRQKKRKYVNKRSGFNMRK